MFFIVLHTIFFQELKELFFETFRSMLLLLIVDILEAENPSRGH